MKLRITEHITVVMSNFTSNIENDWFVLFYFIYLDKIVYIINSVHLSVIGHNIK